MTIRTFFQPLLFTAVLCCAVPVFADDLPEGREISPGVLLSGDGTTTTYLQSFFEPFSPKTLADMIDRIPGVSISSASSSDERRGLRGNEDAILVNGQQITGKDSGGLGSLDRLSATKVKRIEVIRGASSELQGSTERIVNIVLDGTESSSVTASAAYLTYSGDGTRRLNPEITYNLNTADARYTLGFQNSRIYRPWDRIKITSDSLGADTFRSDEFESRAQHTATATGQVDRKIGAKSNIQVNALLQALLIDRDRSEAVIGLPQAAVTPDSDVLEIENRDRFTAEISAELSTPLSQDKTLTVLGVYNWEKITRDRNVRDNLLLDAPVVLRQDRADNFTEVIGRGVIDWSLSNLWSMQTGLEATFNSQRTDFDLQRLENGEFQTIPVFNSNGTVQEYRGEVFGSLTRQFGSALTAETALAIETSQINQTGIDVDSSRKLTFFKPSFNAFWDLDRSTKLFASVTRDVGQLDFGDFVASISERDEELEAGNPDLQPERSWDMELGAERRLRNGGGVVSLSGFYRRVQDVTGRQAFESLVSQVANIGDGTEFGFEAEASLKLAELGLWSGSFTSTYLRRHTSVEDPVRGGQRPFDLAPSWELELEYRHDVSWPFKGEFEINFQQNAKRFVHDVDYVESTDLGPQLRAGISTRLTDLVEVDFRVTNILNSERVLDRELFAFGADRSPLRDGRRVERHQWGRLYTLFFLAVF